MNIAEIVLDFENKRLDEDSKIRDALNYLDSSLFELSDYTFDNLEEDEFFKPLILYVKEFNKLRDSKYIDFDQFCVNKSFQFIVLEELVKRYISYVKDLKKTIEGLLDDYRD